MFTAIEKKLPDLRTAASEQCFTISGGARFLSGKGLYPLEAHPDLVLSNLSEQYLTYLWNEGIETSRSSVVLKKKKIRLPICIGGKLALQIQGLRLIGNQIIGNQPASKTSGFSDVIVKLLRQDVTPCDGVLLEAIHTDSNLYKALYECKEPSFKTIELGKPQPHHQLIFSEDNDYWSKFSKKTRYNFRRTCRLFEHHVLSVKKPEDVEYFLNTASQISKHSWQYKKLGTRISPDENSRSYFSKIASIGALRCYLLFHHDKPVAFIVGTQWQGVFNLEEVGYDQNFADRSPGTILLIRAIEDMLDHNRPNMIDFGFGDGKYKQLFGNKIKESVNLLACSNRFPVSVTSYLHKVSSCLNAKARDVLKRLGLTEQIRQFYRS